MSDGLDEKVLANPMEPGVHRDPWANAAAAPLPPETWGVEPADPALRIAPKPPEDFVRPSRGTRLDRWLDSLEAVVIDGKPAVALTLWWPPSVYQGFALGVEQIRPASCEVRANGTRTVFHPKPVHEGTLLRSTVVLTGESPGVKDREIGRGLRCNVTWRLDGAVLAQRIFTLDRELGVHPVKFALDRELHVQRHWF